MALYPWHAVCFHKWYSEFFHPATIQHHDIEEHIFFKAYIEAGAPSPDHEIADHKTLVQSMNEVLAASKKLYDLAVRDAKSPEIPSAQEQLKTTFAKFDGLMCAHLAEEEVFWPPHVLKQGQPFHDNVIKDIVSNGVAGKGVEGETFKMIYCAISEAIGGPPKASEQVQKQYGPFAMQTEAWCSKAYTDRLYYNTPFFVRWFLRPTWDHRFQTLKATIESVWGNEDMMKIAV